MSQAESPWRLERKSEGKVGVQDVRQLMGASTPHFALQLRERIRGLIAGLPDGDPARLEGQREIARLERLGVGGETRGQAGAGGELALASLSVLATDTSPRTH